MPIRKILVPLSGRYDPQESNSLDRPALIAGLSAGQRLAAHVEVLCVTAPASRPEIPLAAWVPGHTVDQLITNIEEESEERHKRARASFEAAIGMLENRPDPGSADTVGFSVEFVDCAGEVREVVGARGRLADMIVVANSPERWRLQYRPILDAVLCDTGRPLLVSPPNPHANIGHRIAVAWNGSIEASRAVAAMADFAPQGAKVAIMSIDENGVSAPTAEDAAAYLRRHGIESEIVEMNGDSRSSGDLILDRALEEKCDLLVMGACIHSRAHRMVYGSMTATVLARPEIPVLMAT